MAKHSQFPQIGALCDLRILVAIKAHSLAETYQGEVISVWDNTGISGRNKPNIYQASVRLSNGDVVNIVCQRSCIVGQKLKVEKFMPLIGWSENYYNGT